MNLKKLVLTLFTVLILAINALSPASITPQIIANAATLLPTGGSEYDYDPDLWEASTCHVNCYAYAVLKACAVTAGVKLQPGQVSGEVYTSLTTSNIVAAVQRDKGGSSKFYKTTATAVPPSGFRKVALVIAPGLDYHWYEQNSDGYWSHKQGLAPITNVDASGNLIANPQDANRSYTYVFTNTAGNTYKQTINYSTFSGFYLTK